MEKVAIVLWIVTPRPACLLDRFPLASTFLTFLLKGSRLWMAIHSVISGLDVNHAWHPVVCTGARRGLAEGKQEEEKNQAKRLHLVSDTRCVLNTTEEDRWEDGQVVFILQQ